MRAHVEVAAVAAPGEIELATALVRRRSQQVGGLHVTLQAVVLEVGLVGQQRPSQPQTHSSSG